MKDSRKSFFYNSSFRVSIYLSAWVYLNCFKIIAIPISKLNNVIEEYGEGSSSAPAKIAIISGTAIWVIVSAFSNIYINWNFISIIQMVLLLIAIIFLGWLSLIKYRDYEIEKNHFNEN
jgi:hypothetical protein